MSEEEMKERMERLDKALTSLETLIPKAQAFYERMQQDQNTQMSKYVSEDQARVLRYILDNRGAHLSQVKRYLTDKSMGRISDLTKELENFGYIVRTRGQKGIYSLYLTKSGYSALKSYREMTMQAVQ